MFSSTFSLVALAAALVAPTAVNAHGYVHSLDVGGKNYTGWLPFTDPYESPVPKRIVRKVPDDGPVMSATSADIACNKGGESPAGAIATAPAGSKITFDWVNWPSDHMGPVDTYMTSCNGDCSNFDASNAKWFKIDAAGYSNGKWAATQLIENGAQWTSTIPAELKAGEYLVRHSIVALHSTGEPQYYPSCAQVKVTGGGGKVPSGDELVSIPGLYNSVKWPDIWDNNFKKFTIPGPAVAFSGSSSGSGSNSGSEEPESSSSAGHASSTHVSSTHASVTPSASSTKVAQPTSSPTESEGSQATSIATSSAPASTGRCSTKRRRGMVKRRVSHHAKRHH